MKVTGVKRLMKQLSDLPKEVQAGLEKSIDRTVNLGVSKAKALAPSVTGDFKNGINGHIEKKSDGAIFGFINLYEGEFMKLLLRRRSTMAGTICPWRITSERR